MEGRGFRVRMKGKKVGRKGKESRQGGKDERGCREGWEGREWMRDR